MIAPLTATGGSGRYDAKRCWIQTGDVIAFGGKGTLSGGIKFLTRSPVSHVGIALRRESAGVDWVDVIESTSLGGTVGVQVNRLSDHVARYAGEIWWLALRTRPEPELETDALGWIFREVGRGYDLRGAVAAGADLGIGGLVLGEDPGRWFCSELAAEFLRRAGMLPHTIHPPEWTPRDLVAAAIYGEVEQLAGEARALSEANQLDPLEVDRKARDRW